MSKTIYRCEECGATAPRWAGQCTACGAWNTMSETAAAPVMKRSSAFGGAAQAGGGSLPVAYTAADKLAAKPPARLTTDIGELDRVLGGGVVPGSFVLLGGEPGIGKSTLTLQLAARFAEKLGDVLLASGEESPDQIALRARRTNLAHPKLHLAGANDLGQILAAAHELKPKILIVDSVQVITCEEVGGMAGSIPQIRAVAEGLLHFAKTTGTPVFLIGHVTKEGDLAGPRVLSHLVDVVLTLEGDNARDLRLLRATKNRFGATSEVGVFEMTETGLAEVANPSAAFLAGRAAHPVGSCITATLEGTRPLLVEVQALTAATSFGYPRRAASGFDVNRLQLLIAVLARHAGVKLDTHDVFVNVVGGLKLREPAVDLAVCLALASSRAGVPLPVDAVAWGEVGLTGEIRAVSRAELRAKEAGKMGFEKVCDGRKFKTVAEALANFFTSKK